MWLIRVLIGECNPTSAPDLASLYCVLSVKKKFAVLVAPLKYKLFGGHGFDLPKSINMHFMTLCPWNSHNYHLAGCASWQK